MKAIISTITFTVLSIFTIGFAQNTVGLISFDEEKSIGGYNLLYPEGQPNTYLINQCGELVNTWEDSGENEPGEVAYLMNDGHLLRSKTNSTLAGVFNTGGTGGIVEIVTWDNEILWSDTIASELIRQHHDVHAMENGNVLVIAWEKKFLDEIIANGFDTVTYSQVELWPDFIREINPFTNETVWEWHAWDHMIQDYDSTKLNYGDVAAHPELIDINYQDFTANKFDWLHSNSLDYDPVKDQVLLSVRHFNEIWIIDHSTTTEEAAGHTGGNSGRGGDLLFRWGNPYAYKSGGFASRQLFGQHDAQWVDDFVSPSFEFYGGIALFNNKVADDLSLGHVLMPVFEEATQSYAMSNGLFLPEGFSKTYSHPDTSRNHSIVSSSIQIMEEGHVIMCAARQGFSFELDEKGETVWEYMTPFKNGFPIEQGTALVEGQNFTFQVKRYPENFTGFAGKDLSPKGYIELNPNTSFCTYTDTGEKLAANDLNIYPNPVSDYLHIENKKSFGEEIIIYNTMGKVIFFTELNIGPKIINVENWMPGIYFIKNNKEVKKIMVLD